MLSTANRPALRPRPPGQRRASHQEHVQQLAQSANADGDTCSAHNASPSPSRAPFSDIRNTVPTPTVDADYSSDLAFDPKSGADPISRVPADTQTADQHESLTPSSSAEELDHALLAGLDRYELEELLIQASRKVREREQKLVVAANIGKALLEKNLTLQSGIMTSMASTSSMFGLTDIEAMVNGFATPQQMPCTHDTDPYASPRPLNSPPTTDIDIHSQGDISPGRAESDTTPIAHTVALTDAESDYFSRPMTCATAQHLDNKSSATDASASGRNRSIWTPSDAGLIASQPCSPSASICSFASQSLLSPIDTMSRAPSKRNPHERGHRSRPSLLQLQAFEAQRQLASLGEQNDVLYQQISELQHEAESARYEGSKKLGKLNKEIRGLKAELEAATRRNVELETGHLPPRLSSAPRSPLRDFMARSRQEASSPLLIRSRAHQQAFVSHESFIPSPFSGHQPTSDHQKILPSTSNLEDLVLSAQATTGESALLAQLLAKIKELEETNHAMAKAEEDFGSRMGRAMEEDERLRDAFNTVGQDLGVDAAASASSGSPEKARKTADFLSTMSSAKMPALQSGFITPSHSLSSVDSVAWPDVPSLLSPISPGNKRRAPGNRHTIEHRKTIRSAISRAKKELAADLWRFSSYEVPASVEYMSRSSTEQSLGTYSVDLSASSSAASSPKAKGLDRKVSSSSMTRPRIRITPSMEDLGRRRKKQEEVITVPAQKTSAAGDWQDVNSPIVPDFSQHTSLSPSDAVQTYSARLKKDASLNRTDRDSLARMRVKPSEAPTSGAGVMHFLLPSQQKSFNPSARVRRSRSKSSSFGSEASFRHRAGSMPQSSDPFTSAPMPSNEPTLQHSPASTCSHRGRTLESEFGSIFGGDERKHDFDDDLPQRRRPAAASMLTAADVPNLQPLVLRSAKSATALVLRPSIAPQVQSDRPTSNMGRLVPENKEEHADDLECVLTQSVHDPIEDVFLGDSPLRPRDAALLSQVDAEERGAWLADHPIIEPGGLQDEDEPRGAQFDLISSVVEQQAVAWADDDDYGRTISKCEAIKLGLLAPDSSPLAGRSARLLQDKSRRGNSFFGMTRPFNSKGKKPARSPKEASPFRLEIESSEQVEHRLRIKSSLRRRRQQLLRERGFGEEWEHDAHSQEQEEQLVATYVPTPQRLQEKRRQTLTTGRSNDWSSSSDSGSPFPNRDLRRSTQQWVRDLACVSPAAKRQGRSDATPEEDYDQDMMALDCVRQEDADFEFLDCPSWKKQGGRGTDYFPTSFRARYRPDMVKQRVAHVSQVTYGWVEEWVQFAFVVFLAFVVMVEQGPNRNMRRGRPNAGAPLSLLNTAE
ncbi:uncharacterized protein MEPE_02591 [Melanopsichium pennsylvanicum]|uniref:Uncharacterized protein n=2 Tax=Melanopsichium pennsylvanicum TaxID=63383 RepID=A0AAJ4XKQ5_9BASI|nr:putative protein [Melanopsichium pennsylvanicum 4]SNX83883.1 uncharacterized protein MEPE_02591 [Melanopsichium pennsylvanicum]